MIRKKHSNYIILGLLILLCAVIYWNIYSDNATMDEVRDVGIFCILGIIYIYMSWYQCSGTFINGYIIFVTAFYAFNLGQPVLQVFGYVDDYYNLLMPYNHTPLSPIEYFNSAFIGLIFVISMHIGSLISLSRIRNKRYIDRTEKSISDVRGKFLAIRQVSKWFMIISFPFWAYMTYQEISFTAVHGYGGAFYSEVKGQTVGIVRVLGDYFEPAVLSFYFSCEYLKRNRTLALLIILFTLIVPPLIVGGRSQAVIAAAITLVIYSIYHKVKWKKILIIGVGVYVILNVLFLVKKTRQRASTSLKTYIEILTDKENSPVSATLSEMGHSMYPLAATMDIVPQQEDYRYGTTYFWATTAIIPNVFGDKHPAQKYANLGQWLMKKQQLDYGPGYSIAAEAYINWGYYGFVFFIVFGYLMAMYCGRMNSHDALVKPFLVIGTIIFLWFAIKTVRNSFVGMVRAIFYFALLMSWSFKYYYIKHCSSR